MTDDTTPNPAPRAEEPAASDNDAAGDPGDERFASDTHGGVAEAEIVEEPGEAASEGASEPGDDEPDAVTAARAEAQGHLEDLKRLKAEFDNYRKRMVREQSQIVESAERRVVERLLPVLDNFELALLAADQTKDYEKMVRGVELVFSELVEMLRKAGLQKIEAAGAPFDPELHEAVMQEEGGDGDPVVVDVMRHGYVMGDRVLRPAMVKVGKRNRA